MSTPPRENIILVGFASTGKSTTGQQVAKMLGWRFVDLDDIVEMLHVEEKGVKRQCREIFSLFGRDCFVNYETRALERLEGTRNTVIATGGGTPIGSVNRRLTTALGYTVYLNADVRAIFRRMAHKGYPMYLGKNPSLSDLDMLWQTRHAVYSEIADLVVDNSTLSPEEVAREIVTAYRNADASAETPV